MDFFKQNLNEDARIMINPFGMEQAVKLTDILDE